MNNSLWREKCRLPTLSNDRTNRKSKLEEICAEYPDIKEKRFVRDIVGRLNPEKDQSLLFETIVDIAMYSSSADARRKTETIRSVKTLYELTEELKKVG